VVFNVNEFHQESKILLEEKLFDDIDLSGVDISTDDMKHGTPFTIIDNWIKKELEDKEKYPELDEYEKIDSLALIKYGFENMVSYQDLENRIKKSSLHTNKHKELLDSPIAKIARREVNYTSFYKNKDLNDGVDHIDPSEIIITVSFYHSLKSQKVQSYRVLGSQKLTTLKDRFYCLSDHIFEGPTTKSSFFFIENTFYNDTRNEGNLDYSEQIIKWSKENERILYKNMDYKVEKMEEKTFLDLNLAIGKQYLYYHQSNCEHIMVFEEVRRIDNRDILAKKEYPLHVFQCKVRRKKCMICNIYVAKFITFGDQYAPENPCFYCDRCYRPFHYDEEGNLLYSNFKVFPYYHE